MPDILHIAEDFIGEFEQYLEHPVAENQRNSAHSKEFWHDGYGHIPQGCNRLQQRYY
jgi:hypothetical protein